MTPPPSPQAASVWCGASSPHADVHFRQEMHNQVIVVTIYLTWGWGGALEQGNICFIISCFHGGC